MEGELVLQDGFLSEDVQANALDARDGAAISQEEVVKIKALEDSEIVLVDTL